MTGRFNAWAESSGKLPNAGVILASLHRGDRPSLAALRRDAPPAIVTLIKRAWAQRPAARPTAAEAAAVLKEVFCTSCCAEESSAQDAYADATTTAPGLTAPPTAAVSATVDSQSVQPGTDARSARNAYLSSRANLDPQAVGDRSQDTVVLGGEPDDALRGGARPQAAQLSSQQAEPSYWSSNPAGRSFVRVPSSPTRIVVVPKPGATVQVDEATPSERHQHQVI